MARLFAGEKEHKEKRVQAMLKSALFGITESEAAETIGWDRRRLNNYLRKLEKEGKAQKKGRSWRAT